MKTVARKHRGPKTHRKSLLFLFPLLAAEWHPTLNGELDPGRVTPGSNRSMWWRCDKGDDHEWQTKIVNRTNVKAGQTGCPFCHGDRASITNSLASLRPDLAPEWHPELNGDLLPQQVVAAHRKEVWWRCQKYKHHVWKATVVSRTKVNGASKGAGCPFCSNRRAAPENCIRTLAPVLASEWHPTRNGDRTIDNTVPGTPKPAWWKCARDASHEWKASPNVRWRQKTGCPECDVFPRSAHEVRLAFELAFFLGLDPADHKIKASRGRPMDVDMLARKHRLVIEYDGAYWHSGKRDKDRAKTAKLKKFGWNVVRVRERPLKKISRNDVLVPLHASVKTCADAVLLKLERVVPNFSADRAYLRGIELVNEQAASAFLDSLRRVDKKRLHRRLAAQENTSCPAQ